ncbi:hypothetical protein [Actinomycetospora flava]|uniref:DUF4386 family protein n=1 Tax=Actinomycetospora flava TaxID=3129232 RepID=A0ABU8ME59_9PSEU
MTTPLFPSPAWRRAALVVTPLGPLVVAALRWLLPYDTTDDHTTLVAKVASHPGAESAVLWLSLVALLALPLGILVVGAVAVRARPVLGTVAAVLAWCSFATLPFLVSPDQIALAGVEAGLPTPATAAVLDAAAAHPVSAAATTLWVAGHILGLVLLGAALWRTIPTWAAVALIVSQPLHFMVAVIVPNHVLDGLAWLLTTVAFAVTAAVGLGPARTGTRSTDPVGATTR